MDQWHRCQKPEEREIQTGRVSDKTHSVTGTTLEEKRCRWWRKYDLQLRKSLEPKDGAEPKGKWYVVSETERYIGWYSAQKLRWREKLIDHVCDSHTQTGASMVGKALVYMWALRRGWLPCLNLTKRRIYNKNLRLRRCLHGIFKINMQRARRGKRRLNSLLLRSTSYYSWAQLVCTSNTIGQSTTNITEANEFNHGDCARCDEMSPSQDCSDAT